MIATELEIVWLAGLLEGEGCFVYGTSQNVMMSSVDEDVIAHYCVVVEKITGNRPRVSVRDQKHDRQQVYCVGISGENARKVMRLIVCYMGQRRRAAIWQALNKYKPKKKKLKLSPELMKTILARRGDRVH